MTIEEQKQALLSISEESAYQILIQHLKRIIEPEPPQQMYVHKTPKLFEVDIQEIIRGQLGRFQLKEQENLSRIAPAFYSAAWELSLRGILRPSRIDFPHGEQQTVPGDCYSITLRGRKWLSTASSPVFIAMGDIADQLAKFQNRFGDGYHERAQEAVKCFFAGTYFACCAMSGAAAESILLKLAIEKTGDEPMVLQKYHGANGRKELKDKILALGQKPEAIKNELLSGFTILSYWRDDAAHGSARSFDSTNASISLQLLCLFALASEKHWSVITKQAC